MVRTGTASKNPARRVPGHLRRVVPSSRCHHRLEQDPLIRGATTWEIYNLIRGSDPSPGAGTTLDGASIQFYRAAKRDGESGRAAGEVAEITNEGFALAAKGGTLLIDGVQPEGSGKVMAPEWVEAAGLRPGARFGG